MRIYMASRLPAEVGPMGDPQASPQPMSAPEASPQAAIDAAISDEDTSDPTLDYVGFSATSPDADEEDDWSYPF